MRTLVTGGAGFIGSHIVELLLADPEAEVRVFDNLLTGKRENVPERARFIEADIRDRAAVREASDGVDVVFHEAAFVSIRGSFERLHDDLSTNCEGSLIVFEEAARAGVRKVVFASSMAVYGLAPSVCVSENSATVPVSPYGLSKLRGEMYLRMLAERHGFEHVILRYFNTYGTRQTPSDYVGVMTTFIRKALLGQSLTVYGDGKQTRDFVHVHDIARANLSGLAPGVTGTFNVGSGIELSIDDLADAILEVIGGTKTYLASPPGEIDRICADLTRAENELGYKPRGTVRDVMGEIVEYWRRELTARGLLAA